MILGLTYVVLGMNEISDGEMIRQGYETNGKVCWGQDMSSTTTMVDVVMEVDKMDMVEDR